MKVIMKGNSRWVERVPCHCCDALLEITKEDVKYKLTEEAARKQQYEEEIEGEYFVYCPECGEAIKLKKSTINCKKTNKGEPMSYYPYTSGYWLCYSCGRNNNIGQQCICYNSPRICGAQNPEYKQVFCNKSLYGITAMCYYHQGLLSQGNGEVILLQWSSSPLPLPYKLTVTTNNSPIEEEMTIDEVCDYILEDNSSWEFFATGKNITKQMKQLMRKYRAIKEIIEDEDED